MSNQRGFTTMELLMASTLFILVLGSVLTMMDSFWGTNKINEQQNQSQTQARQGIDRVATDLRSIDGQSQLIEKATATDIVFKTADPFTTPSGANADGEKRVRYCLANGTLYRQEQTWTTSPAPSIPSTVNCPDTGWSTGLPTTCHVPAQSSDTCTPIVTNIVNPLNPSPSTSCPPAIFCYDSANAASVHQVTVDLQVNTAPSGRAKLAELQTSVTLRNTDQPPVASFFALPTGNLHVDLDASNAYDPEGSPLTYRWCLVTQCTAAQAIGTTSTLDYVASGTGSKTFYLDVWDAGGLMTEASSTVTVS
ncbi:MAG: hypothetical protein JOZ25_08360 [Actinobacteria bacterium]|nr:hypothetical protein [Actinomycetota bacterium]